MTSAKMMAVIGLAAMVGFSGCSGSDNAGSSAETSATSQAAPSPELQPLVVKGDAPAQHVGVAMARTSASDGEEVVVEGRLKDFVDGKAAFTIVDGSIPSCLEDGMEEKCPTPWDYCCTPTDLLNANTALVKLVNSEGETLDGILQGINSIDNLSTVVVTGKAEKDPEGNLTISANKVYLK